MKSIKFLSVLMAAAAFTPNYVLADAEVQAPVASTSTASSRHQISLLTRLKEASERTLKEAEADFQKHISKPVEQQDQHYLELLKKKKAKIEARIAYYDKKLKEEMNRKK